MSVVEFFKIVFNAALLNVIVKPFKFIVSEVLPSSTRAFIANFSNIASNPAGTFTITTLFVSALFAIAALTCASVIILFAMPFAV